MIKKLLITKHPSDAGELNNYCIKNNISCLYHSFLTFEALPFHTSIDSEVLFFSSKRSVQFFFEKSSIHANQCVACIGKATKNELESRGFTIDFTSINAGNPELVSKELKEWIGTKSIAIISSVDSYKTIATFLDPIKTSFVSVYKTILKKDKVRDIIDILVFTSPSNVEGYLTQNKISKQAYVIAWGTTTARYLFERNIQPIYTLSSASESELIEYLERNFSS